jgi:hypothetical protein
MPEIPERQGLKRQYAVPTALKNKGFLVLPIFGPYGTVESVVGVR